MSGIDGNCGKCQRVIGEKYEAVETITYFKWERALRCESQ